MATISITIPDAQLTRVVDALCSSTFLNTPVFVYDAGGSITKNQFAKQKMVNIIKAIVLEEEAKAITISGNQTIATTIQGNTAPDIT